MSNEPDYLEHNKKRRIQHSQKVKAFLLCYDVFSVSAAFFVALWLRFDLTFSLIPDRYLNAWRSFALIYVIICIVVFYFFRLYNSIWRFASFRELQRITLATGVTCLIHIILITVFFTRMPISYYIMGPIIQYLLITGIRFSYRFYAASDFFMMPSLFEPCGLGQMIAQRYGTLPIVRRTGGLKDSVINFDSSNEKTSNGFGFDNYHPDDMKYTCVYAYDTWFNKALIKKLKVNAMKTDNSWRRSAKNYLGVYKELISRK